MKQVPYTNTRPHAVTIGTKTIAAGDTRMVDESLLGISAAKPKAEAPADPVKAVKELKMAEAVAAVPDLTDEQLDALEKIDERKGIAAAIAEERLKRAQAAGEGSGEGSGEGENSGEGAGSGETEGNDESDGEASED